MDFPERHLETVLLDNDSSPMLKKEITLNCNPRLNPVPDGDRISRGSFLGTYKTGISDLMVEKEGRLDSPVRPYVHHESLKVEKNS